MPATLSRPPKRTPATPPPADPLDSVQRFTLAQYQDMIDARILGEKDRCHLINGVIRKKMADPPPPRPRPRC